GGPDQVLAEIRTVLADLRTYTWLGEEAVVLDGNPGTRLSYAYNDGANTGDVVVFPGAENTVIVDLEPAARMGEVYEGLILFLDNDGAEETGVGPGDVPDVPVREALSVGPPLGLFWGMDLWDADARLESGAWDNSFPAERGQAGDYERGPYMEIYRGGEVYGVAGVMRLYYGDERALVAVDFQSGPAFACIGQFEMLASGARQDWGEPSDSTRQRGDAGDDLCAMVASGAEGIIFRDWWAGPGDWWANQTAAPQGEFVGHHGLVIGIGEMDGESISYALWEHDTVLPSWQPAGQVSGPLAYGLVWGMDLDDVHAALSAQGLENRYPGILGQPSQDAAGFSGYPYLEIYDGAWFGDWAADARYYFGESRGLARMVITMEDPEGGCGAVFAWIIDDFTSAFGPPLSTPPHSASWACGAGEWGDGATAVWEDGVERLVLTAGRAVAIAYEPY
ncbi:hypothetical protein IIA16_04095, partial [bacterium]|nr:hypothetical protein [bacterium]